jgi:AraC-like DNA-binding protein
MLQKAYGESAMKKTSVYEWYKCFQDGRKYFEDDECSGRPRTSIIYEYVKKVEKMVMNDRRIPIREIADEVGISIRSFHNIFSNVLGMKRVAVKFIPKLLNFVVACS